MSPETKKKVQIFLVAAIVLSGARAAYIFYQRRNAEKVPEKVEKPLVADYYVTPKKLRPYDLDSAKQLTQQPVWVKEGYRYTYYPFDKAKKRTDFEHEAGTLLPIQKLEIKDVVKDATPGSSTQKQLVAAFEKDGKSYGVPVGTVTGESYQIYADEMFYIQDPRELYKHWPSDVWEAIEQHQVKPGMNELQANFAVGMGVPEQSGDGSLKTLKYANGGKPMTVSYREGKAVEIQGGT